jgi:hypothetical protein
LKAVRKLLKAKQRPSRPSGLADESNVMSGRLEHLFETVRNPKTEEPYTDAEVARMTLGDLLGE